MIQNAAQKIEAIRTRDDLAAFLDELNSDFRDNPDSWPNNNLRSFLEALAAWTQDMDGYYANQGKPTPRVPEWKTFADMLIAATMYE